MMRASSKRHTIALPSKFGAPVLYVLGILLIPTFGFAQAALPQQNASAPPPATETAPPPAAAQMPPADAAQTPPSTAAQTPPAQPPVQLPSPPDEKAAAVPARLLPHNLSPWGMFLEADIVVKVVMIGLACASLVTWTVWLAKTLELFTAKRRASKQLRLLASASSLTAAAKELGNAKGAVVRMVEAAAVELDRSADLNAEGVKERAAALISRIEARAGRQASRGTGVLGTIGAISPFVGLFGTVWGIMNSFIGISKTNTTNLAVVAPGIAQALLATAFGLVAAIPAVIIYNYFARSIASYRAVLGDAAAEILRHVSRDLDRGMLEEEEENWRAVGVRRRSAE